MVHATRAFLQAAANAIKSDSAAISIGGIESATAAITTKRPRGRPFKNPAGDDDAAATPKIKPRMGRPPAPKKPADEESATTIKRPRGRPPMDPADKKRAVRKKPAPKIRTSWLPSDDIRTKFKAVFPKDYAETSWNSDARDHLTNRADIVGEQLCDDIIKYLAPTLEPYKGCTIIDVNPGVCLWSSKLHDFLQPKRHILMEPDEDYVEPFIKPLLEAPGSTYRHTTMTGAHPRSYWSNYATLFTDGKLMDPRPSRAPDDPKLNEIDYSLLVTGNLSRRARNVLTLGRVRHAELILQHMFWAGLARDLMHNRGPVRMLWWTSDVVKSYLMQRNMCGMVSFNCAASVCASVTPVVECVTGVNEYLNGPGLAPPRQLTPSMVGLSRRHAEERLAALGMTVPEDRPVVHPEVNVTDDGEEFVFPGRLDCESIDDLADAVDLVESRWHRFSTAAANGVGVGSSNQRLVAFRELAAAIQHPQVKAMVFGAAAIYPTGNDYKNKFGRIRAMLYSDSFLAVFHLEANYKNLEERLQAEHGAAGDDGALARRLGGLRERILALGESVHDSSPLLYDRYHHITEDQIAMFAAPPRGVPHKRRYPSLEASPGDALPAKAMTLLDVVPRTADYRVAGLASRGEVCAATHELIKALFHSRSRPFLQALEQIAPGAVQDLLPSLPTLADPRRGGRLNPHRVVVRQLTDEMIDELMQAWFEWPFRPSYGTISCGSREGEASGMHESGAEEDDGFD